MTKQVDQRWGASRVRRTLSRVLVLAVIALSTPGAADVAEELIAHALGVECCDDARCCESAGESCPGTCAFCACCAHPTALPTTPQVLAAHERPQSPKFACHQDRLHAPGYRTPPFRPPTA